MFVVVLSVYPFLEINFLLQGAICFLFLSLYEAYRTQPTAESRTKYFGLFFGVVLINRISLFYSPAVQPHWRTAVAAWDADRGVVPQLKQRLGDSQIAAWRAVFIQLACHLFPGWSGCLMVTRGVKIPGGKEFNRRSKFDDCWLPRSVILSTYALCSLYFLSLYLRKVIITDYTVKMKCWM